MRAKDKIVFAISQLLPAVLMVVTLYAEKARPTVREPLSFAVVIIIIDLIFLRNFASKRAKGLQKSGDCDIIIFVWVLLIIWELITAVYSVTNPVLFPCPENVFDTFRRQYMDMLKNALYSFELLTLGFVTGMTMALFSGLFAGWLPRLRGFAYPIANVLAPIPPVVFSPYLVAIMPSFRSASVTVIVLGIFWPTFLTTINRVRSIDSRIIDAARMLNLDTKDIIFSILLPYVIPGVVTGLKVSLTTSVLMLNFAELMGATHGLGYYIQNSITYANYTQAVAGIICVGIFVTLMNFAASYVQKKAVRWR